MTDLKKGSFEDLVKGLEKDFYNIANELLLEGFNNEFSRSLQKLCFNEFIENKRHIFELFGNKLKIETEIDTVLPKGEISNAIGELVEKLKGGHYFLLRSFLKYIGGEGVLSGAIADDIEILGTKFKKGTRVAKVIGSIVPKQYVHEAQTAYSMFNQSIKTKGKLVISIDPIDFITMSTNSSGWRSCHRVNGGEYATGPFSYLMDNCTAVCYIASSVPTCINGVQFSNKTWRQLMVISPDHSFMTTLRQYPSRNAVNSTAICNLLVENLEGYSFRDIGVSEIQSLTRDYFEERDDCGEYLERRHYSDIENGAFNKGSLIYNKYFNEDNVIENDNLKPLIGTDVPCLACGTFHDGDNPICEYCQDYEYDEDF